MFADNGLAGTFILLVLSYVVASSVLRKERVIVKSQIKHKEKTFFKQSEKAIIL